MGWGGEKERKKKKKRRITERYSHPLVGTISHTNVGQGTTAQWQYYTKGCAGYA